MEKTIEVGGVRYTARRRTNLNEINFRYFRQAMALFYEDLAIELGVEANQVSMALVTFGHISSQITGGVRLLSPNDSAQVIIDKCKSWLNDGDLFELGAALTELLQDVDKKNPDSALAPDPLPEGCDQKKSTAVKRSKKPQESTG